MSADTIVGYFGEDKFFEWFSAVAWFAAAVLFGMALQAVIRRPGLVHPVWYFGLLAITFIAAGEEISWGQRLFDYETPAVIANSNLQGEMNLHNLELFDVRTSVDGDHKTGIQRWLTFGRMGSLIWIGFLVILPLATKFIPPMARFFGWARVPVPPIQLAYFGIVGYMSFLVIDALNGPVLDGDEQSIKFAIKFAINEYKETLVAALFLCAAIYLFMRERHATATEMTRSGASASAVD
ncbi:MAG: hypothetical protein ACR2P1_26590 [Pseudomonadales bacterium]